MDFVPVELEIDRYHNRGVDYLDGKKYEEAAKMFRKEIECDREGHIGYWFLANALREMGKEEEARANYKIAIEKAEEMYKQYPEGFDREIIEEIRKDFGLLGGKKDSDTIGGK